MKYKSAEITEKTEERLDDVGGKLAVDAFAALPQFGTGESAVGPSVLLLVERRLQLRFSELPDFLLEATGANEIHNPTHFESE